MSPVELLLERENLLRQQFELAFGHRAAWLNFSNVTHLECLPL
jgi:hypothetical protein